MLFITKEKSFYELLREYLVTNSLMKKELSLAVFNSSLLTRSQELGFKSLESYCRYVIILPYLDRLREVKLLVPNYNPITLYQSGEQLEELSQSLIGGLLESAEKASAGAKYEDGGSWLTRVLTQPIEIKKNENDQASLRILFPECGEGEEAYSMGFRLKTILSKEIKPEILACESNSSFMDKIRNAEYPPGKIVNLHDNYRSLYLDKNKSGYYVVADSIKKMVNIRKYDILTQEFSEEYYSCFNIISCNNLVKFYPAEVSAILIDKMVRYLSPGGLLFAGFPDGKPRENISPCLDVIPLGKTYVYRRNSESCRESDEPVRISHDNESMDNQLMHIRGIFLDRIYDRAKKLIEDVLNKHIDNLIANEFKGDIYVALNESSKALLQYRKALLINGKFLPAHYNSAVLLYRTGEKDMAVSHLDEIDNKIENVDEPTIQKYFDINVENFRILCTELRQKFEEGLEVDPEKLRERFLELKITNIEAPNIEVPDPFKRKNAELQDRETSSAAPTMPLGERKVVNISELPSTRDYGEHDPWKKKMQELEERRQRGEVVEEEFITTPLSSLDHPSQPQSQGTTVLPPITSVIPDYVESAGEEVAEEEEEEDDGGMVYRMPKSLRMEKTQGKEKKGKKKKSEVKKKTKKAKSSSKPAKTKMYLKPMSPDAMAEEEEYEEEEDLEEEFEDEEEYEEDDEEEEEEEEVKPVRSPLRNLQLSLRKPAAEKEVIKMEVGLPQDLSNHIDLLIIREDLHGLQQLLLAYQNKVSYVQRDILKMLEKVIHLSLAKRQEIQEQKEYKGKLKETYQKIQKVKNLLRDKNLLEASIMFQQLINMGAAIKNVTPRQRRRIEKVKNQIEKKTARYQDFIDQYFTDPVQVFQKDLWDVLAQLTPRENLVDMGKKYGLDPQFLQIESPPPRPMMTANLRPQQFNDRVSIPSPVGEIKGEGGLEEREEYMLDALGRIDFFESLSRRDLRKITRHLKIINYSRGEEIITQGDPGEVFFLIKSGSVNVVAVDENGEIYMRKMLREGNYFGEISLLTGDPRTATVTVIEDVELFLLNKGDFKAILREFPALDEKISEKIAYRQKFTLEQMELARHKNEEEAKDKAKIKLNSMSKDFLGKIRNLFPPS